MSWLLGSVDEVRLTRPRASSFLRSLINDLLLLPAMPRSLPHTCSKLSELKLLWHCGRVVCVHPRIDPSLRAAANGINVCAGFWKACTPACLNVRSQKDCPSPGAWDYRGQHGPIIIEGTGSNPHVPKLPLLLFIYLVSFGNSLICAQHVGVESPLSRREVQVSLGAVGLDRSPISEQNPSPAAESMLVPPVLSGTN